MRPTPLVLMILDGWGYSEATKHNAIYHANTPNWDRLWEHYPHTLLAGSGKCVGLPNGQMGNSEVGHLNMGAGRIVPQDFTRIQDSMETSEFEKNKVLLDAIETAKSRNCQLHILGLLSPGGVHSHEDHINNLIKIAADKNLDKIYLHSFLDGRDTPPKSAMESIVKTDKLFKKLNCGQMASITGRYYAMDRDKRWDRVQLIYDLLTQGESEYNFTNPIEALNQAYERGETDEFVKPSIIYNKNNKKNKIIIENNDVVIFMNFRADRARELSYALTQNNFDGFKRVVKPELSRFVTLTQYSDDLTNPVIFEPNKVHNGLGEWLSSHGLTQLRAAETEKYAHVTFFFNGGIEEPFPNEHRELIPSPKVATYDLQPEMSAYLLTDRIVSAIDSKQFDMIICNYANPDMVGHTGNFKAAVEAVEVIDNCIGKLVDCLEKNNGELLITADHGNVECMLNETTGQAHTAHTNEPVPLLYIGRQGEFVIDKGKLSDIAPTILTLLNIKIPQEMTGRNLFQLDN